VTIRAVGGLLALTLALGPALAQAADRPVGRLTLELALEAAARHPRLAQARAAAAGAAARLQQARAGWFPSADLALGAWLGTPGAAPEPGGRLVDPAQPGAEIVTAVTAGVSQPVWDFGRTGNQVRAGRAAVRAAGSDLEVVWADVDLGVRLAYHDAVAAEQLLRITGETVTNLERRLGVARMLVEVGKRPPSDVTKSRIDLANGRLARLAAASALTEVRLALAAAIGWDDLGEATLETPPAAPADPSLAEILAGPLARRPELRSLDAQVAAQSARLAAQRSSHWPLLTAGADVAVRGIDPPVGPTVPSWQLGLTLTVPLLAGGADLARAREQQAALSGLEAARSALVLQLRLEARRLVDAVAAARARAEAARAIVVQAREHLAMTEARYTAGVGNIIELADAQTIGAAADAQQVGAEHELAVARARLQRAVRPAERR
jgi:outer membrane protein TolC